MLAIKGGKVITMTSKGTIDNAVVLIEGDSIQEIGSEITIPAGCEVVDAGGLYILPGFIDAHTHIGLEEEIYQVEGDDVNETSDPITPQLRALDGINFLDLAFKDALRGGVTRMMCMPGSANIIGGQAVFLKAMAPSMSEMVYRQPWGLKAALGENPKRVYGEQKKMPRTRMANASMLREALYTAGKNIDKTVEPAIEFRQQSLIKVLRREMPLLVHAHRADDILTALRIKDEFDIDMIIQHATEAVTVADELIKRQVPIFIGPLLINRAKVELKDVSFKNAMLLAEKGLNFSIITDHPVTPVEHLRVTVALAVREGLDETTALEAITINPSTALKVDDEIGSLSKGKKADLVAFNGHPLDNRSRVKWAMVDGRMWRGEFE